MPRARTELPIGQKPALPTRNLGLTGYKVGIFSLGGQGALERPNNQAIAVPIVERALDLGVNYIDTSSIYGGPQRWSERYIGEVMRRRRAEPFWPARPRSARAMARCACWRSRSNCCRPTTWISGNCTISG
jgi:hypothetical protein